MKKLCLFTLLLVPSVIIGRDKRNEDNGPIPVVYTPCPQVKKEILKEWAPTVLSTMGLLSYYFVYKPSLKEIYSLTSSKIISMPTLIKCSVGIVLGSWIYDYYKPRLLKLSRYFQGKKI